jgi:hypothetical protein
MQQVKLVDKVVIERAEEEAGVRRLVGAGVCAIIEGDVLA